MHRTARGIYIFAREHIVLMFAALFAAATALFVPPDEQYLTYMDWKTLGCLFSVLAVANAFMHLGAFDRVARIAIERFSTARSVVAAFVVVTILLSMVATNDMALLIMLPLSATTLVKAGWPTMIPVVFAMQSIAANLCGMIIPFGNPQNLYLYSYYSLSLGDFLATMFVPFAASAVLVALASWLLMAKAPRGSATMEAASRLPLGRRRLVAYLFLTVLAFLAVFRVIPVIVSVAAIILVLGYADRRALKSVDYPLLFTFAFFFIFAGESGADAAFERSDIRAARR